MVFIDSKSAIDIHLKFKMELVGKYVYMSHISHCKSMCIKSITT